MRGRVEAPALPGDPKAIDSKHDEGVEFAPAGLAATRRAR